ncbi:STAS domain-containing protein [Streptomyces sp. NPDC088812]|uniref:STAS domain-containing protein n=1 Tax=Streptomyces sp. NPDC088812 TaxID=3365905 RepID=UPI0038013A42
MAEPQRLTVSRAIVDEVAVVTVTGEVDHDTAGPLRRALTPADGAVGPRTVVDLGGVTFLDSSGINVLIAAHQAHGEPGWLRLADVRQPVLRTLQLVGIDTLIACYPTPHHALNA